MTSVTASESRRYTSVQAIDVNDVSKTYPGVRALRNVSLSVAPGEIVGLVGHNGAGKSTLTRILGGAERPDDGEIHVEGTFAHFHTPHDAIEAGISVVPQRLTIVPMLTVEENIILGSTKSLLRLKRDGALGGGGGRRLTDRVRESAQKLDLEGLMRTKVRDTRPSTQRLVMIARAMLREPKVMVLDEPTAALHPDEVQRLLGVAGALALEGMAIVFISHRLDEVLQFTSRVIVMREGGVVANRPTKGLDKHHLGELIAGRSIKTIDMRNSGFGDPVLRCDELFKLPQVEGVSLEVRTGEVVGVAGLNGSGRSKLLRMIAGLERPERGTITIQGARLRPSRRSAIRRAGIAYLPDDRVRNGVVPEMTVAAHITLSDDRQFRVHRWLPVLRSRREAKAIERILAQMDVHPASAARRKMKHLSGGNQQKVLIARAMTSGARLYVFDEPTEGVDIGARADLHRQIRQLAADGAAVLFASSESDEIATLADRVLVMYEGRITKELVGAEISEASITHAVVVG